MITFDGNNKLIICGNGVVEVSAIELYSLWKEWVSVGDNSKYLHAFTAIGGDPLYGSVTLGSTFFLENGWRIRPHEANHTLTLNGNLYVREGGSPFVPTIGTYNVLIIMTRSNLIDTVSSGGSVGPTADQVATAVWNKPLSGFTTPGVAGEIVTKTERKVDDNQALIISM